MVEQKSSLLLYGKSLHLSCRHPEALHKACDADDTSQRRPAHRDAQCLADNGNLQ